MPSFSPNQEFLSFLPSQSSVKPLMIHQRPFLSFSFFLTFLSVSIFLLRVIFSPFHSFFFYNFVESSFSFLSFLSFCLLSKVLFFSSFCLSFYQGSFFSSPIFLSRDLFLVSFPLTFLYFLLSSFFFHSTLKFALLWAVPC